MRYYIAENEPSQGRTSTLLLFVPVLDRDDTQRVLDLAEYPKFDVEIRAERSVTLARINSMGAKEQHTKFVHTLARVLNQKSINGWEN